MTRLLGTLELSKKESETTNADVVFVREDVVSGKEYRIYANRPTNDVSWFQWGESNEILSENVEDLETYFSL